MGKLQQPVVVAKTGAEEKREFTAATTGSALALEAGRTELTADMTAVFAQTRESRKVMRVKLDHGVPPQIAASPSCLQAHKICATVFQQCKNDQQSGDMDWICDASIPYHQPNSTRKHAFISVCCGGQKMQRVTLPEKDTLQSRGTMHKMMVCCCGVSKTKLLIPVDGEIPVHVTSNRCSLQTFKICAKVFGHCRNFTLSSAQNCDLRNRSHQVESAEGAEHSSSRPVSNAQSSSQQTITEGFMVPPEQGMETLTSGIIPEFALCHQMELTGGTTETQQASILTRLCGSSGEVLTQSQEPSSMQFGPVGKTEFQDVVEESVEIQDTVEGSFETVTTYSL